MSEIINGCRVENSSTVTLCGGKICCPKLERLSSGNYKLTDDCGNVIIITAEQARLISNGVDILENNIDGRQIICG